MREEAWQFPEGLPIGNEWLEVPESQPVIFPYDGSTISLAPVGDESQARRALDEAVAIKSAVGDLPAHLRRTVLREVHQEISAHRGEFEDLLVLETGKPLVDCRVEMARALLTLEAAAEEVARLHGETVPLDLLPNGEGLIGFWVRKPIGVVVGVAGFNYPVLLAMHKIAPAFAAGCPIIVKPAPQTPLATLWLVHIFREALARTGGPRAAVQLVTGGVEVGVTLTTDRRIGAVSFTGSSAMGHQIAKAAAPTKVLLELGSNAALIVAADADLDSAADAIVRGGFYASGQACISVQRVLVVEEVREELLERLNPRLAKVVLGDPRDPATTVSALIDDAASSRVQGWINSSIAQGARLAWGGGSEGRSVQPTVLLDVADREKIWEEEVFAPVIAVRSVPDLETAFTVANESRYGLHVSLFTTSLSGAFAAAEELEAGGVIVNEVPGFRSDIMPYGGVKDSGVGREGPRFAMEELTVTRMVVIRPHLQRTEGSKN